MEEAQEFYEEALQLVVARTSPGLLQINLNNQFKVMLYTKPNHTAADFTVLNFEVDDIENVVRELKQQGIKFEKYPAPIKTDEDGIFRNSKGPKIAWFKDPSGNILSLLETSKD